MGATTPELSQTDGGQLGRSQATDHKSIDDPDAALEQVTPRDRQCQADEGG